MMRAISLHQPWALFMAKGWKRFETRDWGTALRGELAICAAKTTASIAGVDNIDYPQALLEEAQEADPARVPLVQLPRDPAKWSLGKVVAVVEVYDCFEVREVLGDGSVATMRGDVVTFSPAEFSLGGIAPGRWLWATRTPGPDPSRAPGLRVPVPVRGMQKIFVLPRDVEEQVRAQLAAPAGATA